MPFDSTIQIEDNRRLGKAAFVLSFRSPTLAAETLPGQFIMLGFPGASEPLLRRPYSIYQVGRASPDLCEVQYKVVGKGTARLAGMRAGEKLSCLGPLGKPFHLPPADRVPVLVAGGIGIAGLLHLGNALLESGRKPRLLYGCRGQEDLELTEGFHRANIPVEYATEDGSRGLQGRVTALLEPALVAGGVQVFACGPEPMLRAVARSTAGRAPCQISMESYMACGFGVCLGCVVRTAKGTGYGRYVRVCMEGPVFSSEELAW